jgi:hypothetical protein
MTAATATAPTYTVDVFMSDSAFAQTHTLDATTDEEARAEALEWEGGITDSGSLVVNLNGERVGAYVHDEGDVLTWVA